MCGMKYLSAAFIFIASVGCGQDKAQDETVHQDSGLSDASFATWRDQILATESELLWEKLPWLTTYHEGLEKAAAKGKPLLLWVMNGHPLGCT